MALLRDTSFLIGGGVLGVVFGTLRAEAPPRSPASPVAEDQPDRAAQKSVGMCSCAEVERLQLEARFRDMLYQDLWEDHFGHPVAWPTDTPVPYTQRGFYRVIDDALADCDTEIEPRGTECSEPPCIGAFVVEGALQLYPKIAQCGPWVAAFGDAVSTYSTSVDCDDGSTEVVLLLSPYWKSVAEPADALEAENYQKRIKRRQSSLLEAWKCGSDIP